MGSRRYGLLAALVAAALPAVAQVPRRAPCRTQCAFEVRLRGGGCCPVREAPAVRRATPPCGSLDHLDGARCCGMGESWNAEEARCLCAAPGGCGPERCAGTEPEPAGCEAMAVLARPRYEAPTWVLERRFTDPRREESLHRGGDPPIGVQVPRDPVLLAAHLAREVDLLYDIAAQLDAGVEEGAAQGRQETALRGRAREVREGLVRSAQAAIERVPGASVLDSVLFRMAVAQAALARHDDARRTYRTLLQRFPRSPYVPHAHLAFAEHFFAQREWGPAAQFYERARLPADATNRARAYALYRLAWTRLLSGSFAASLARFDETLAWANAHPDAPDIARLAAVAREEREVAAWAAAPGRTVAATRSAPETDARREVMAQAADALQAAGDWRGAVVLYRRLLAQRSLDARYCAWRAAAARAMDCLAAPPREGSAPDPREGPRTVPLAGTRVAVEQVSGTVAR